MRSRLPLVLCLALGAVLVAALLTWASGALFMRIFGMDTEASRPWTIFQYWSMYAHDGPKKVRLALLFSALLPASLFALSSGLVFAAWKNSKKRKLHGAARFSTLGEARKAGLLPPPRKLDRTILVGKFRGHYLSYPGSQFVCLAAPTRSGKGVSVVIPNCLNFSDSIVVLDIKGENFDVTSGFRSKCGQEVYLFAPFDESGRTNCYNPLDFVRTDPADRLGDIDAIAAALYSGGSEKDRFWSEMAKDLFRGLALFVLEQDELPHTFGEILRQASGKGKTLKEHVTEIIQERDERSKSDPRVKPFSDACRDSLSRILANSENTLASIISTFNTPLLLFQNPRADMATSRSDFDLRDVRRKRMSVYFAVQPDRLHQASVLVNLFFDQLLNLNTRALPSQDPTLRYQCLVVLDEMTSIGRIEMISQAVSYMAGYGMRLLTVVQNKSQLEAVYGKAGAVTILSNHALMVMFAPSPAVQSDANEYSEMLGYETVKAKSTSRSKGGGSESLSDQRRALMLPQEIRELGRENEIVALENAKPILCKKIRYYEDPAFIPRANLPVPDIPQQDVHDFIARIEERSREATEEDLKDLGIASAIAGTEKLRDAAGGSPSDEEIRELIERNLRVVFSEMVTVKAPGGTLPADETPEKPKVSKAPDFLVPEGEIPEKLAVDQETYEALIEEVPLPFPAKEDSSGNAFYRLSDLKTWEAKVQESLLAEASGKP